MCGQTVGGFGLTTHQEMRPGPVSGLSRRVLLRKMGRTLPALLLPRVLAGCKEPRARPSPAPRKSCSAAITADSGASGVTRAGNTEPTGDQPRPRVQPGARPGSPDHKTPCEGPARDLRGMGQVGAAAEGGHLLRPNKEASAGTGPWGSCSGGPVVKHVTTGQVLLWGPRTAQLAKSNGRGVGEGPHGPRTTGQPPS